MSGPDAYAGAPVTREVIRSDEMKFRISQFVSKQTDEIHRVKVLQRAAANEGCYPTMQHSRSAAEQEATTLMRALGMWSAMPPGTFDNDVRPGKPRPLRPDDRIARWKRELEE